MIERIRAIFEESAWLLEVVLSHDFNVELAIRYGNAALDDLLATDDPTDAQSKRFSQLCQI